MFANPREVFVYNKSKETFLSFRVRVADSFLSRMIGLLGKRSLKPDGGVWIVPANSIHTVGMLFSFDLVMVDKDFRVVNVKEMVSPFRIVLPKLRAESVLELPQHTIFRSRTAVGDQLVIERYEVRNQPGFGPERVVQPRPINIDHAEQNMRNLVVKTTATSSRSLNT